MKGHSTSDCFGYLVRKLNDPEYNVSFRKKDKNKKIAESFHMLSASMSLYLLCLLTVVLSECDTHQKFNVWLTSDMNKLLFHRHSASNASVVTLLEFSSVGILSSQADS